MTIEKGLFRIYVVLSVIIATIFYWRVAYSHSVTGTDVIIGIVLTALVALIPWITHYIVKWIIAGFKSDRKLSL